MQVAQPAVLSRQASTGAFEWQQVEDHHRPACPSAPHPPEEQRSENLGDGIMDDTHLDDACQQTKDRAFELRVFMSHEDRIKDKEETDEKERQAATDRLSLYGKRAVEGEADSQRNADVTEHDQRLGVPRSEEAPKTDSHKGHHDHERDE